MTLPVAYNRMIKAKKIAIVTPLMALLTKAASVAIVGHSSHVYLIEYLISSGALPFSSSTKFAHFSYSFYFVLPDSLLLITVLAVILVNMISLSLIPKYLEF